jgi:hypothetical protein
MTAGERTDTDEPEPSPPREPMVGFGSKQAWLAFRDTDADAVSAVLGLSDLGAVSWRAGVDLSYLTDDRVVLTPPLPGAGGADWLLVAGRWLVQTSSIVDIVTLSDLLATEVQYFATHRVVELHRWQRANEGELLRSFAYLGETGEVTDWRGEPSEVERTVGLPAVLDDDEDTDILVGETDVMRVAAAWSLAPVDLDGLPSPGPLRAAAVP